MIHIPVNLMLSPITAFADREIGSILQAHKDLLDGNICIYIWRYNSPCAK
jgi:hypothetical protein